MYDYLSETTDLLLRLSAAIPAGVKPEDEIPFILPFEADFEKIATEVKKLPLYDQYRPEREGYLSQLNSQVETPFLRYQYAHMDFLNKIMGADTIEQSQTVIILLLPVVYDCMHDYTVSLLPQG